jgi:DNA sulfur modification protein DndD
MIFLELVLQNFGPYKGRHVINLDISPRGEHGHQRPILLLGGKNGGGKTTLMDALRLALYGHRAQCSNRGNLSYGDFLTQCVNSHASPHEKTRIELVFEHIENDIPVKYRIVRTWERNPKDGKDQLGILGDDDTWPVDALANIWDEYIENLLPLGISNLFLFDGEQVKELAEQEIPPPIVVDAIRNLLGLELAERLAIDLDILINRKRKELAEEKELYNLEEIEQKLQKLQQEHEKESKNLVSRQAELKLAKEQEQEATDKFISEGGKIAAERSYLEKQVRQKSSEIEQICSNLRELAAGVLPLALIQPILIQAQNQGEKELQVRQAQIAKDILKQRDKRLLNFVNNLGLSKEKIEKIQAFLLEDEGYPKNLQLQCEEAWLLADEKALSQLGNVIYYLQNAQATAKQQLAIVKVKEEEISGLEKQMLQAASPEEYKELRQAVQIAQKKVAEALANCETVRRRLAELEVAMENLKKKLKDYTESTIKRKNKEHIITASAKVQETLKLFRERLTLRKLNKLETEVTKCFRYLLHKSDLVHSITIDTKTFGLFLYDQQSKVVPKHRLSAGEKQMLAIAFLWSLARVSNRHLPVVIDTPLGRLDSSHRNNLVERYFPFASHQVILLSTDTEIGPKEVSALRQIDAIAREYLLQYDSSTRQTTVIENKYFW